MKKRVVISALILSLSFLGCSNKAQRIEPGNLEVSQNVAVKIGTITNIVQLEKKEASSGKELLGGLTGALIGSAIAGGNDNIVNGVSIIVGTDIGTDIVRDKYGKTIYKLTITLNDGSLKEVYAKGGKYTVNKKVKVTIDKNSGKVTSFIVIK